MTNGQFCFLTDQYYIDFPDKHLMQSKESVNGMPRRRPCFFVFKDKANDKILWLVPVSSQYKKFKAIYDHKMQRYGKCNTIRFGTMLGVQAAFLIQNICPVTEKYIQDLGFIL